MKAGLLVAVVYLVLRYLGGCPRPSIVGGLHATQCHSCDAFYKAALAIGSLYSLTGNPIAGAICMIVDCSWLGPRPWRLRFLPNLRPTLMERCTLGHGGYGGPLGRVGVPAYVREIP